LHQPGCCIRTQVKALALAETEAAAGILSKAERLIKSLALQREQQRDRERQTAAAGVASSSSQETVLRAQMADLQVGWLTDRWMLHLQHRHLLQWTSGPAC
jgi:hypothetical protein